MIDYRVKLWLIAELRASAEAASVLTGLSGTILSADSELPSKPGVYIAATESAPEARYADMADFDIHIVAPTEAACHSIREAVYAALWMPSGSVKTWHVDPGAKGLSLKSFRLRRSSPPQPTSADTGAPWASVMTYRARGRDESAAA